LIDLKIKFWCELKGRDPERKLVKKIAEGVAQRHQKHPEHVEAQIDVLMRTYQLVTHLPHQIPDQKEYEEYLACATAFKTRGATTAAKKRDALFMLIGSAYGLLTSISVDVLKQCVLGSEADLPVWTRALALPAAFTLFKAPRMLKGFERVEMSAIRDTELSSVMKELADLKYRPGQ